MITTARIREDLDLTGCRRLRQRTYASYWATQGAGKVLVPDGVGEVVSIPGNV